MLPFRPDEGAFDINAACGRAIALQAQGETAAAAQLWRRIVVTIPDNAEVQFNLGATLLPLGEFAEAEAALRKAVALKPGWASPRHRLGNLLYATGRWSEAEPHYLEALRLAPDVWRCAFDLANLRLGRGDLAGGWPFFEQRRNLGDDHLRPPPLPNEWLGEPPTGKSLLVWPEQGFGDQIQFARFVPELAAQGADVTLLAPPELARLFEHAFAGPGVRVVAKVDGVEIEQPDHWALVGSLPGRLGVTLPTLSGAPYLSAPQAARNRWKGFAPQGGVGVVWQGRAAPNPHRSLPSAELLEPLARAGANLIDISPPPGGDFADVAAMIEQLDLIVTIDTAAAHLAGAMGKPCWVMLPWLNADWRWMQGRDDSPWYDSVRLFRQPAHGDWNGVIQEVAAAWTAQFGDTAPVAARQRVKERG
jgi:hypothetical protein